MVHADQRHVEPGQLAGQAQQRAVAAEHHGHVGLAPDLVGGEYRVAGEAGGLCGLALEDHVLAVAGNAGGQFLERALDAGGRVPADQGNGLERGAGRGGGGDGWVLGGRHAGIRPYRRDHCQ
ncbi:hypothetical protein D3C86_1542770 [compost metagenome]